MTAFQPMERKRPLISSPAAARLSLKTPQQQEQQKQISSQCAVPLSLESP